MLPFPNSLAWFQPEWLFSGFPKSENHLPKQGLNMNYWLSVFLFPAEACNVILSSMPHRCLYPTFLKATYPEGPGKEERNQLVVLGAMVYR